MPGLKIVLPKPHGHITVGDSNVKFFVGDKQIKHVTSASISIEPSEYVTATLTFEDVEVENTEGLLPLLEACPLSSLQQLANKHGYKLVKDNS